jgi:Holliday junction resolvase RusA-like endonuclease
MVHVLDNRATISGLTLRIPGKPVALSRMGHGQFGGRFLAAPSSQQIGRIIDTWERAGRVRFGDDEPLALDCTFTFARPASHFGTGRNAGVLKERYQDAWPTGRPDTDNLLKLVCEALQGNALKDDSKFVRVSGVKRYGPDAETVIEITRKPRRYSE